MPYYPFLPFHIESVLIIDKTHGHHNSFELIFEHRIKLSLKSNWKEVKKCVNSDLLFILKKDLRDNIFFNYKALELD